MLLTASSRHRLAPAWIFGLLLIAGTLTGAPARAQDDAPQAQSRPPASLLAAEMVETSLGGFFIRGEKSMHRLSIPDLDFVEGGDGERLLPLLRLLGVLQIGSSWQGDELVFFSPEGVQVRVSVSASGARIGTERVEGTVLPRVSDLTGNPELFIADSLAAHSLAFDLSWNEALYAFEAVPRALLPVFERTTTKRRRPGALTSLGYDLPEPLGPATPNTELARVDFLQARLRARLLAVRDRDSDFELAPLSAAGTSATGSLLGGNYRLAVRQQGGNFGGGLALERATWSRRGQNAEVSAGDRFFGLSSLVFPTVSTWGVVVNGLTGLDQFSAQRDLSGLGSYPKFPSALEFTGDAPIGSKVELRINGQLVAETTVDNADGAEPGTGVYLFEGINLFSGRANDVHILITEPDGTLDEIRKEVIGATNLLQTGQFAFVGGAGVKRNPSSDEDTRGIYGKFAGVRGLYGISRNVTAGATIAWQEKFSSPLFAARNAPLFPITSITPPENTLHSGAQLQWRAFSPFLLSLETATVSTPAGSEDGTAWLAEGSYRIGRSTLDGRWFRYSSNFFDGSDERLRDRQGVSLDMSLPITNAVRFRASGARVENNVDQSESRTNVQHSRRAELATFGLIPGTNLTLRGTHMSFQDEPSRFLGGFDLTTSLVPGIGLQTLATIGDDLRSNPSDDLFEGLSIPGVTSFEVARTLVRATYSAGSFGRLSLSHSQSTGLKRTLLGHDGGSRSRRLQWRTEVGIDWDIKQLALQNRIDYFLDRAQTGGLGLELRRTDGRWSIAMSIQQEGTLSFLGGSPKLIVGSRVNPERGGVKGQVFLDADGDGILDPGERGLSGFTVLTDRGFDAVSDEDGTFFLPNSGSERLMRVSFDAATIPATFTPTNGTQQAQVRPGLFTTVNLGLATFAAITGSIRSPGFDGALTPTSGVRVQLFDEFGAQISESITARDGTYYLDGVVTGSYTVRIDPKTIPSQLERTGLDRPIEVVADSEFTEIEGVDFTLVPAR